MTDRLNPKAKLPAQATATASSTGPMGAILPGAGVYAVEAGAIGRSAAAPPSLLVLLVVLVLGMLPPSLEAEEAVVLKREAMKWEL